MSTAANRLSLGILFLWVTLGALLAPSQVALGSPDSLPDPHTIGGDLPQPVGDVGGSVAVDPSGNATYSIPIVAPPGRKGVQPHLGITYNSGAGNGTLGVGWSLTGLSFLGPCFHPVHHAGVRKTYDQQPFGNLEWCLDGVPLAPKGQHPDYVSGPTHYVTVPDMHQRISPLHLGGARVVEDPNGWKFTYADYSVFAAEWDVLPIVRAEDPDGNYITYEWIYSKEEEGEKPSGVPLAVKRIRYTGNSKAGLSPSKVIEFSYEDGRADPHFRNETTLDKLLTKITVTSTFGAAEKSRWYELEYTTSPVGLSLLRSVQECVLRTAGSKVCKSPTTFEYQLPESGYHHSDVVYGSGVAHPDPCHGPFAVDLNGDGADDLLWAQECGSGDMEAIYSRPPDPGFWPQPPDGLTYSPAVASSPLRDWTTATLSNDMRKGGVHLVSNKQGYRALSNFVSGTFATGRGRSLRGKEVQSYVTADLNGDGLTDILSCESGYDIYQPHFWYWYEGNRDGSFKAGRNVRSVPFGQHWTLGEEDPDFDLRCSPGRVDLSWDARTAGASEVHLEVARTRADSTAYAAEIRRHEDTGEPFAILYASGAMPWQYAKHDYYSDFNADGIPDAVRCEPKWSGGGVVAEGGYAVGVLHPGASSPNHHFFKNFASFNPQPTSCDVGILDLNRDGFPDLRLGTQVYAYNKSSGNLAFGGTVPPGPLAIGDFDGDGRDDLIYFEDGDWVLRRWNPPVLDDEPGDGADHLLRRVVNGYGRVQEVEYGSMTHFDLHRPDNWEVAKFGSQQSDPCPLPARCVVDGRSLVRRILHKDASDAPKRDLTYRYEGARSDVWSGEWLGFRQVYEKESILGGSIIHRYSFYSTEEHTYGPTLEDPGPANEKGFLLAGMPVRELTIVNQFNGRDLASDVSYEWEVRDSAQGGSFVALARVVRRAYDAPEATFAAGTPDLDALDGVVPVLEGETEIVDYDAYGNPLGFVVTVGRDRQVERHFQYTTDPERWLLRRVQRDTTVLADGRTRSLAYTYGQGPLSHRLVGRQRQPDGPVEQRLHDSFSYDNVGNISLITQWAPGEPLGSLARTYITYDKDEFTYPTDVENELGHRTVHEWDPVLGMPYSTTDPFGVTDWTRYDAFGRVMGRASTSRAGELLGMQTAVVHYRDSGVWPEPSRMRVQYLNSLGAKVDELYGENGRLVSRVWDTLSGPGEAEQTWRYDWEGRVRRRSNPAFVGQPKHWLEIDYDAFGRVVRRRLPGGAVQRFEREGLVTRVYDAEGNPPWSFEENEHGELAFVVDSLGTKFCYGYDGHGLLSYVAKGCGDATPEEAFFERDELGRLLLSSDPGQGTVEYTYDGYDRLRRVIDGEGQEAALEYDVLGRLISHLDIDEFRTWTYDTMPQGWVPPANWTGGAEVPGLLVRTSSSTGGRVDLEYDTFGRGVVERRIVPAGASLQAKSYVTRTKYDQFGRVSALEYPTSHPDHVPFVVEHEYAGTGELTHLRDAADGTVLWQLVSLDAAGRVVQEVQGNSLVTETSRDIDGRVRFLKTGRFQGGAWSDLQQDYEYTYTPNGNMQTREDHLRAVTEIFHYDVLNRLTEIQNVRPSPTLPVPEPATWTIDEFGNIDYRSDVGVITSEPNGRLISAGGKAAEYDENGNLLSLGEDLDIDWYAFGKPASIRKPLYDVDLEYGPDHQVSRRVHSVLGDTFYAGRHFEVKEAPPGSAQGREVSSIVYAYGRPVAIEDRWEKDGLSSAQYLYPQSDAHGSVNRASDEAGMPVSGASRSYGVWGEIRPLNWVDEFSNWDLSKVNIGFTGHRAQVNGGLLDMGGRHYDAGLARFASADPVTMAAFDTQAWNRYSYVRNNPATYIDPTGYVLCDIGYVCGGGGEGLVVGGGIVGAVIALARMIRRAVGQRGANAAGTAPPTGVEVATPTVQRRNTFFSRTLSGAWSLGDYQQVLNGMAPYQQSLTRPGLSAIARGQSPRSRWYEAAENGAALALGVVDFHVDAGRWWLGELDERAAALAWVADNWRLVPETFVMGVVADFENMFISVPALGEAAWDGDRAGVIEAYGSTTKSVWSLAEKSIGLLSLRSLLKLGRGGKGSNGKPKALEPVVKRQKQLEHVVGTKEHTRRVAGGGNPSVFTSEGEAIRLTREAYRRGQPVAGRPNVREYDFQVPVGTSNGFPTSRVRVHQDKAGRIHGHPF